METSNSSQIQVVRGGNPGRRSAIDVVFTRASSSSTCVLRCLHRAGVGGGSGECWYRWESWGDVDRPVPVVHDPEAAIGSRRDDVQPLDASKGIDLRVVSDRPIGLEFRKIGADEQILIFSSENVVDN